MLYMPLNDKYYDFGLMVMIEIAAKLGSKESRPKSIYFARFLMMLSNHVCEDLVIENAAMQK